MCVPEPRAGAGREHPPGQGGWESAPAGRAQPRSEAHTETIAGGAGPGAQLVARPEATVCDSKMRKDVCRVDLPFSS